MMRVEYAIRRTLCSLQAITEKGSERRIRPVSISSNAQRLVAVPDAEESSSLQPRVSTIAEPVVCSLCFGTGMEVVPGKGARRCRCRTQDAREKLLEDARLPRRHDACSLGNYQPANNNGSQLHAFNYAYRLVREYP